MRWRSFGDFQADSRGGVALVFGLAAVPLIGMAGAALDYSRLTQARTSLQNAADAAALSGAAALFNKSGTNTEKELAASTAATEIAISRAPGADKTIAAGAATKTVTVSLTRTENLLFGGLLGQQASTIAVTGQAAFTRAAVPVCLLALDPTGTGVHFRGSGSFKGADCLVWSNSTSATASMQFEGSPNVTALSVCANGKVTRTGSASVSPVPKENCGVLENPLASWTPPAVSTTCTSTGQTVSVAAASPGVFCGTSKINGTDLTLASGIYVVKDGNLTISTTGKITGTDVQFIVLGTGSLTITAGSDLHLTAPQDSSGFRVLVGQSGVVSSAVVHTVTGNSKLHLGGSIHLPDQKIALAGNATVVVEQAESTIVAKNIEVAGSGKLEFRGRRSAKATDAAGVGDLVVRLIK